MRMWEVEDNKAVPSNLVLEQDFVLRVRRLNRLGTSHLVVNVVLSAIPQEYGGRGPLEVAQGRLRLFANNNQGTYAQMSNGDVFLVWPESGTSASYIDALIADLLPEGHNADDLDKLRIVFHLPTDYTALRERINFYVEEAKNVSVVQDPNAPAQLLQSDAARGPLTAWSVNQIEKLLREVDLAKHIRKQPVYECAGFNEWKPLFEEVFVGVDELRRTYFPRLEVSAPFHLFLEICLALDHALLTNLTQRYELIQNRKISLNISVSSIMDSVFAQFTRRVPPEDRNLVYFELHRADLLQDFEMTRNAINILRHEGFKVVLDGITPDILDFMNFQVLAPDYIKVNVGKDRAEQLAELAARAGLAKLPSTRIIFYHCDTENAFKVGRTLGVSRFQGWLVDKLVGAI